MTTGRSETSIIIKRVVDAPRDHVWLAWTDPSEIDRWWGPMGLITTTHEMDVETGGKWSYTMTDSDGSEYRHLVTYGEVVERDQIDYALRPDEPEVTDQLDVSVYFTDMADKTHVKMEMRFASKRDRDEAIEYGVAEGTRETLERLAGVFEGEAR